MTSSQQKIQVFALGGTIDKVYFDALSEYQVGEPQVGHIFKEAGLGIEFQINSICSKDSLEITEDDREKLRQAVLATEQSHILITHGTDTMTVTAQFLKDTQDNAIKNKTIVLVGSMNPACFKNSDAAFNVGFALGALQASAPGIYIAMNGSIFTPETVRKNREAKQFQHLSDK